VYNQFLHRKSKFVDNGIRAQPYSDALVVGLRFVFKPVGVVCYFSISVNFLITTFGANPRFGKGLG